MVDGTAVRPLLRIVHHNGLPIAGSVPEAFQNLEDDLRARRQFLTELVRPKAAQAQAAHSAAS